MPKLQVPSRFAFPARYWHTLRADEAKKDQIQCDLCPRECKLHDGQQGLCFVRERQGDELVLTSYGRSSGFCVDPIEKKPLNHFLPGSAVLSFGTAGCNLSCKFCQNWDISKAREDHKLAAHATPEMLALTAKRLGCSSVAYTYNDPVIFLEYAVDVAKACKEHNINNVAVTAAYISAQAREEFFADMDAVNVDLKAFTDAFYYRLCGARLAPILENIEYLKHETSAWLELTTLLIPDENDSDAELHAMSQWLYEHLGADVPLHFSAFHPDWKMRDKPTTPAASLQRARKIALSHGLQHVFTGNIHDTDGGSSYCPSCQQRLIERDWYSLGAWNLTPDGRCNRCGEKLAGVFNSQPGDWGSQRMPVRLIEN